MSREISAGAGSNAAARPDSPLHADPHADPHADSHADPHADPYPPSSRAGESPDHPARCARSHLVELERQITLLAGHLNAAQHRFLVLIAEFDRAEGWCGAGIRSAAHWLNWKCGIDLGAAREKLRVAHALADLPLIGAAMACGELSYSKVRALTRVATTETEGDLLMMARHGTAAHVESIVRGFRRAREALELSREARQFESRTVNWFYDDDGSLVLRARLPAEAGALLVRALEVATDDWLAMSAESPKRNVSAETSCPSPALPSASARTLGQYRADTLAAMAESWLSHGSGDLSGAERQQIIIHVDAATLVDQEAGRCEIEDGPAIAVETARRLACDAGRITVIEDEAGQPLDMGRRSRTVSTALGRALRLRDRGCRFPGCCSKRFVDAHHIRHWARGGETTLTNLVLLCRFHHRLVHEGQVDVRRLDDGGVAFVTAEGATLDSAGQMAGSLDELLADQARLGPTITPTTAVTRWAGEGLDLGLAVAGLMERWQGGSGGRPEDGRRAS